MINIFGGVGTGKTRKLVALAEIKGATVVCKNPETMYKKIHDYGFIGIKCVSYEDFVATSVMGDSESKYLIDDIGEFIKHISTGEVIGFTSNTDED